VHYIYINNRANIVHLIKKGPFIVKKIKKVYLRFDGYAFSFLGKGRIDQTSNFIQ
jgi:hypothetical protein